MTRRGLRLEDSKKLIKFEVVRQEIAEEHALKNPDVVTRLSDLRINNDLNVEIPNLGTFSLTGWVKSQFGSKLGVQWDKWFNPACVKPAQIQEELQRRFTHSGESCKLRTKRYRPGAPGLKKADGYLRAALSPTFTPIDDEMLFDRCERKFHYEMGNLGFMKGHHSKNTVWGNDHCNYYTVVSQEPIDLGPIDRGSSNAELRQIYDLAEREGRLPESDLVYPGMTLRNSEVGYTAVIIDEFSFRLVCLNGMIIPVGESRLMYRQHRPIEEAALDKQLGDAFGSLSRVWSSTRTKLQLLSSINIINPDREIEMQMTKLDATKQFITAAKEAFKLEPLPTMYGVLQAITRAAQTVNEDMDKRVTLEEMAGHLLSKASSLTALATAA